MDKRDCTPVDATGLSMLLTAIEASDSDYGAREKLVLQAVAWARKIGLAAGFRFDPAVGTEWPVAFIELPTGQVSWHCPQHSKLWDNHTTEEKYARCRAFSQDAWAKAREDADPGFTL